MLKYLAHTKCKINDRLFSSFFFLKVINLRDLEESPKQGINVKMFFPVSFKKKTKLILHFSGSNSVLLSTQFFDTIF